MGTLLVVTAIKVGAVPIVQAAVSPIESGQLKPPRSAPGDAAAERTSVMVNESL
ncbi:MAG: hypothetical protein JO121_10665 [Deltaproteobacteria bacterium]|nr:hypothetical protein [Deltaproteobacteria bacterium]